MIQPVELNELADALDLGAHELVSLVGGGGKTTTLLALGRQLSGQVLLTTTTRMGVNQTATLTTLTGPTDDEVAAHRGWGHSTWEEGARLCEAAGVGTYVVFHHDPEHDDAIMDGIAAAVEARRPGSLVAREGLILRP